MEEEIPREGRPEMCTEWIMKRAWEQSVVQIQVNHIDWTYCDDIVEK